ncbi:hypothetical protein [Nocardia sp. NPDC052566]|uniref:hypothetical protein n=1 Tax=Nocardia sp. NPDC052566 TaxID=3364330 RepID=UPI0037C7A9FA
MSVRRVLIVWVMLAAAVLGAGPVGAQPPGPSGSSGTGPTEPTLTVRVDPDTAGPGQNVRVMVFGCPTAEGSATSGQFLPVTTQLMPAADGGLYSEAAIGPDPMPGTYPVDVSCGGVSGSANITVR